MALPKDSDESRQLATWMPVVDQVVGEVMSKPKLAAAIGGHDDVCQVAKLAVLQAIRSPKVAGEHLTAAYLSRCVRNAMRRAATESSLIRVHWRSLTALAEGDRSPGGSRIAGNAKRAMQVILIDDADSIAQEISDDDHAVAVRTMEIGHAVSAAVERLPASYQAVIGHLYGVCGYQKLDHKQIAEKLGIVIGTVRNQACKGRVLLKKILAEYGYGAAATREDASNAPDG